MIDEFIRVVFACREDIETLGIDEHRQICQNANCLASYGGWTNGAVDSFMASLEEAQR